MDECQRCRGSEINKKSGLRNDRDLNTKSVSCLPTQPFLFTDTKSQIDDYAAPVLTVQLKRQSLYLNPDV